MVLRFSVEMSRNKSYQFDSKGVRVKDVLFEAGNPVEGTHARALAINNAIRETVTDHLNRQQWILRGSVALLLIEFVLGITLFVTGGNPLLGAILLLTGAAIGGGGIYFAKSREPDVTVEAVEKGYWTGYCIPDREGVMLYDAVGTNSVTEFNLERLRNQDAVAGARDTLSDIEEFPAVLPRNSNLEVEFNTALNDVRTEIDEAKEEIVHVPTIPAEGPEAEAITNLAEHADEDGVSVSVSVPPDEAEENVNSLVELEGMVDSENKDGDLTAIQEKSHSLGGDLSGMQERAIDLLNDHIGTAADAFGYVSYHFYCPDCQLDDIESRLTLSDPQADEWYCDTCRTEHETADVIPRHQIKDDVVNPVWDQLWIEKDDQRREIYENIEDQKTELQEREFEQRREEIRTATDRIRDLRSRIRDLNTQAKAAEGKVDEIGDLMVKYERLHEDRKEQFQNEVEASFQEIDKETERILEETRNEEQERIEEAEQAAKEKAELMREEERRREAEKFMAEQEMENARTKAQMEQQERHHRENWMLKTRGRTSFSTRIDKAKMRKDRMFGASKGKN